MDPLLSVEAQELARRYDAMTPDDQRLMLLMALRIKQDILLAQMSENGDVIDLTPERLADRLATDTFPKE